MAEENNDVSRRSLLKSAAVGSVGLVAGGSILAGSGSGNVGEAIERVADQDEWFSQRAFCLSGNKVLKTNEGSALPATTLARQIYRPRSAREIADLVKSSSAKTPIACVCGGHESSNAAVFASSDAIVLDLVHLKSIEFHRDDESLLVTVGLSPDFPTLVLAPPYGQTWPFRQEKISQYDEAGPGWYWNNFSCGKHTGTHFDAPSHWITGRHLPQNTVDTIDAPELYRAGSRR